MSATTRNRPVPGPAMLADVTPEAPLRPVRSVDDMLDRFRALHPARLGRQTLSRVEAIAGLAVTIRARDDGERREEVRQDLAVVAAYLCDEGGLVAKDLEPILGRPWFACEEMARHGRQWVRAYGVEVRRKGRPFADGEPDVASAGAARRAHRQAMNAGGR